MEQIVHRFRFRLALRGVISECEGRSIETPEGTFNLQVWASTPEQPHLLLEVAPMRRLDDAWPLLHRVCDHRGIQALEYRSVGPRGLGEWMPVPGAPAEAGEDKAKPKGKKK